MPFQILKKEKYKNKIQKIIFNTQINTKNKFKYKYLKSKKKKKKEETEDVLYVVNMDITQRNVSKIKKIRLLNKKKITKTFRKNQRKIKYRK